MRTLLRLIVVILALSGLVAGTVVALVPAAANLPEAQTSVTREVDLGALDDYAMRSYVYASDGGLLTTLRGEENRQPVELEAIPAPVVEAILAVEDADFHLHGGVNVRATARALLENVSEGGVVQGGSTITQQLVKNALLSADQDIDRKTEEAVLALQIERELTKDEILELYLNTVYFGSGAYGVQAAAETYWGVDAGSLGWAEGAMLAALIANPVQRDPTLYPDEARRQRRIALEAIERQGLLTAEEVREHANAPIPVAECGSGAFGAASACVGGAPPTNDYFLEDVKQQLLNDPRYNLGDTPEERNAAVFSGGLRIYTTIDPAAQFAAEAAAARGVPANDQGVTASMISVEPGTGAVRAVVGGPGFETYQFNIATHDEGGVGGRQTGSAFKTVVLLAALEQGAVPADTIDAPGSFPNPGGEPDPYTVKNGRGGTLTSVTSSSSNRAFVNLGRAVGLEHVAEMARRLGMTGAYDDLPISMPLGVKNNTPLEMAAAYATIASGGVYTRPYMVDRIESATGELLYQHFPDQRRAVSAQTACLATEVLVANVRSGTGTRARLDRQPAAGKTGTTDQGWDTWFVGYTPHLSTAVWMGNPNEQVNTNYIGGQENFGGVFPARMWGEFNELYHAEREPRPFPDCERTRSGRRIDARRGIVDSGSSSSSSSSSSRSSSSTRSGSSTRNRSTPATTAAPAPTAPPATEAPAPEEPAAPPPAPGPPAGEGEENAGGDAPGAAADP